MTFVIASLIVGILSLNGIMIISVAKIYDWEILWYINCQCLPNATQVNTIYLIFLFQTCLNFSVFQIVSPRTITKTKNYKPNWIFGKARHWNSDTRQFVSPSFGDDLDPQILTFIMPLYVVAEVCTLWVVSSRIIVITTHDRSNNCNNFRSVSRNMD